MWKYISEVPKVVEEEKKEKNPKAGRDSKEHEKNETGKFSAKWQIGQPWLQHDRDGVCVWGVQPRIFHQN